MPCPFFRKSRMSTKRRRVDTRQEIEPPTSYEVEKLVAFRERRGKSRGKGAKSILEYKVRWAGKWNDPKYDSWTKKENINEECICEFDGDVLTVGERLATVPAALHPSHPGYAAAMKMSAMASQVVVILQQSEPKKRQPSHGKQSAAVTMSGGDEAEAIGVTDGKSNYCSNLTADSQGEKQSGCNNKSVPIDSNSKATQQRPSECGDSLTESTPTTIQKSSTAVQMKRVFDEYTVTKVTRWVRALDRVVAAGRAGDPTFASQYNSFFTKLQKQAQCMTSVAQWAEHQLKDGEDLLELTIDGWICNM